jgi:hypothetical protein
LVRPEPFDSSKNDHVTIVEQKIVKIEVDRIFANIVTKHLQKGLYIDCNEESLWL